jgi:ABC-type multidrug transport system fused ATPase/permease subunit
MAELPQERAARGSLVLRRLLGYLQPYWQQLLVVLTLTIIGAATQAIGPYLIGRAIDSAIGQRDLAGLNQTMLLLLGTYAVGFVATRLQFQMMGAIGQRTLSRLRTEIFATIQRLSLRFFDRQPAGDLISRLTNDTDVLNQLFSQGLVMVLGSLFGLIGILIAMLALDWRLALASSVVIPLMLLLTDVFSRLSRRAFRRTRESIGDVSSEIQEEIAGVKVAQAFNRTGVNQQRFELRNAANRDANINATAITSAFTPVVDVLSTLATAIVAGYGGYLALNQLVTVGVVVAFLTYVQQFFRPIQSLSTFYTTAQAALAAAERIFELVDTPSDLADRPGAREMPPITGRVSFDHVAFSYGERPITDDRRKTVDDEQAAQAAGASSTVQAAGASSIVQAAGRSSIVQAAGRSSIVQAAGASSIVQAAGRSSIVQAAGRSSIVHRPSSLVLDDITLDVQPGQTIAVVGPTGAGKTTLVNMIGRFYDVDDGAVLVDGIDVRDVTKASLRSQMGVVLQDSFLFSGTVAENIRYGRLDATDAEIEAAAQAAHAHDFIMRLPDGYATKLGERGNTLSQGQRQLLGIARALLRDPRILILDEATSSVDSRTEVLIQSALQTLLKGRTSFVIAHRLSTIRDADQVLVMQAGQIIERGTHDELLARNGLYAELYRRQFRDEVAV